MTRREKFINQWKKKDFNDEINDKEIAAEFLEFSTLPLLYMTEDIQKVNQFYRRAVKIYIMSIAWDFFRNI